MWALGGGVSGSVCMRSVVCDAFCGLPGSRSNAMPPSHAHTGHTLGKAAGTPPHHRTQHGSTGLDDHWLTGAGRCTGGDRGSDGDTATDAATASNAGRYATGYRRRSRRRVGV